MSPIETARNLDAVVRHLKDVEELDAELDLDELPVVTPSRERIEAIVTTACAQFDGQSATTGEPLEYSFTAGNDFSTIIEDEATLDVVHPDLDSLDWDLDVRPMIEVSLDADIDLDGIAFKSDYYSDDDASVDVLDSDWNDRYMWVATHHKGHLSSCLPHS